MGQFDFLGFHLPGNGVTSSWDGLSVRLCSKVTDIRLRTMAKDFQDSRSLEQRMVKLRANASIVSAMSRLVRNRWFLDSCSPSG